MALCQTISTIDNPEFINLTSLDINPFMSKCEIKVLYLGENRNKTSIDKDTASKMAKTLRGAPIVGYYDKSTQDFDEHKQLDIVDNKITFTSKTVPYGFVSPDANVWYQKFEEIDENGQNVVREYMMTVGYIWTGQFPEAQCVLKQPKGQSMELDQKTLNGEWTKKDNSNLKFFIINDAKFTKLCILGENFEPCFEGANIQKAKDNVDNMSTFTIDDKDNKMFANTFYKMAKDLEEYLLNERRMRDMKSDENTIVDYKKDDEKEQQVTASSDEKIAETSYSGAKEKEKEEKSSTSDSKDSNDTPAPKEDGENGDKKSTSNDEEKPASKDDEEDKKKKVPPSFSTQYELLEQKFKDLEQKYEILSTEYSTLVDFRKSVEREEKEKMIKSFYMLSDVDKKDVIDNIDNYSLSDIESKLSVICFRKKVNFDLKEQTETKEEVEEKEAGAVTYNVNNDGSSVPAFIQAIRNAKNS